MGKLASGKQFALTWIGVLALYCVHAQNRPTMYFSRNTVISLLQDRLIKSYTDPSLKKYIYCAPSYCFRNDTAVGFTQVITSKDVNHNKIGLTTYCGDVNTLNLTLASAVQGSYMILSGTMSLTDTSISIRVSGALGSSDALNNLGRQMLSAQRVDQISLNQLSILYDKQNYDSLNLRAKFTNDGLVIGLKSADISLIDADNLAEINKELQSTGVTSIGVFLPLDFVNKQFENVTIPYNDNKGTDIRLSNCKFVVVAGDLRFNTLLSGTLIRNTPIRNTYNVTAIFNARDMTLKSFKSTIQAGNDINEAAQVRIIVNYFENEFRDKVIFALPNQQYYNINGANTHIKLNVKTYYGHFTNGIIAFVNSFNVKK